MVITTIDRVYTKARNRSGIVPSGVVPSYPESSAQSGVQQRPVSLGCVVIGGLFSSHFLKGTQNTQRGIQGDVLVGCRVGHDLFRSIKDGAASKRDDDRQTLRIEFQKCGLINLPPLRPMLHSQSEKEPSREHAVASVAPATSFNRRSQPNYP
jgi:hypothetical protein